MGLLRVAQSIFKNSRHLDKNKPRKRHHKILHEDNKKIEEGIYPLPNFKLLPRSVSIYTGHIAGTNVKTYLDSYQLTKHTLVAGGTGSGKTVSGMVIVEELLKKKEFSVIVFDPVGQWTGFLKENDDKMMLSLYEKFGMDNPKGFDGEIIEVTESILNIDIVHYVNKRGLIIFKLDKLDPQRIDNFIELALERIYRAHLPERKNLRCLLVLDEVHRLLPKYGGGNAYIKLEQSLQRFRKLGIGILLISQVVTDFNGIVKGNIDTDIQMKTNYDADLKRIKAMQGRKYSQIISNFTTGTGLVHSSPYNKGKSYFVEFRPLYHSQFRISESDLNYILKKSKVVLAKDHINLIEETQHNKHFTHKGVYPGLPQRFAEPERNGLLKKAHLAVTKNQREHFFKKGRIPDKDEHLKKESRIKKIQKRIEIVTKYDILVDYISKKGEVAITELSKGVGINKSTLEKDLDLLLRQHVVSINYPFNIFKEPTVYFNKNVKKLKTDELKGHGEVYEIVSDYVTARIEIIKFKTGNINTYSITLPDVGIGTIALLSELKERLVESLEFLNEEIVDSQKFAELKERFIRESLVEIELLLPKEDNTVKRAIAGLLLHQMYGLGDIDVMMADELLEEIVINNSQYPLVVYHKLYGWLRTTKKLENEEEIFNLASQIGRKANRQINALHPIMDAQLFSGDRVSATLFPVSMMGHTITIRKFARSPWSIVHFLSHKNRMMSYEMASLLWIATQYELNILVIGGTASGKTSAMNALNVFIPHNQRVISIEDTKEIVLPKALHWNWVPLLSRNPNQDGQGGISMLDLMISSLRMRPDRIVVGEVRERKQVETMFEAMNTGHAVYATMHADTVEQLKRRLLEPPIQVPKNEVEALHLILALYRDRRVGLRRALELAEVMQEGGTDLEINYLYRWHPRKDEFEPVNIPIRLYESLNLHTGMTIDEIQRDLDEKASILKWMVKNEVYDSVKTEAVMDLYYRDSQFLLKCVRENKEFSMVIKNA
ncbi:Flp pilus assembly complex ATPase component TadA [Candidatus Woesearchaeota archaeon]|nr:Flp pilus assembly complex ATPase component TadA [Candidatus Woesearchaeota archaeon]